MAGGQKDEAVIVLQHIADHNGSAFRVRIHDVHDGSAQDEDHNDKGSSYFAVGEDEDETAGGSTISRRSAKEPEGWRYRVQDYMDRLSIVLQPEYRTTTLLVWAMWFSVSAAYTIFNVFLPKFLEEKIGAGATAGSRLESLQEYCLYTVAGYLYLQLQSK